MDGPAGGHPFTRPSAGVVISKTGLLRASVGRTDSDGPSRTAGNGSYPGFFAEECHLLLSTKVKYGKISSSARKTRRPSGEAPRTNCGVRGNSRACVAAGMAAGSRALVWQPAVVRLHGRRRGRCSRAPARPPAWPGKILKNVNDIWRILAIPFPRFLLRLN